MSTRHFPARVFSQPQCQVRQRLQCIRPRPSSHLIPQIPRHSSWKRLPRQIETPLLCFQTTSSTSLEPELDHKNGVLPTDPSSPTIEEEASPKDLTAAFSYEKNWWPVIPVSYLDPSRPKQITLLGKDFVVWQDGETQWRCFRNSCPHRLVPLSEGRIENGELMCSYHGWQFDGTGACTRLPQAANEKSSNQVTSNWRSCAKSFPTQVDAGLLWIWPDDSPTSKIDAAASLPNVANVLRTPVGKAEAEKAINWYMRDVPYDYDILLENVSDPAHLPFSHHNTPGLTREDAVAMPVKQLTPEDFDPTALDSTPNAPAHSVIFPSHAKGAHRRISFHAPNLSTHFHLGDPPFSLSVLLLYCVPLRPGWSRVITTYGMSALFNAPSLQWSKILNPAHLAAVPRIIKGLLQLHFLPHTVSQLVFDQDNVFLHFQSIAFRSLEQTIPSRKVWTKEYYMALQCDRQVVGVRKWFDNIAGGVPGCLTQQPAVQQLPTQQLLDRYEQHSKHCPVCKEAEIRLEKLQSICKVVAAASLLCLAALAGRQGVLGMFTSPQPALLAFALAAAGGICLWVANLAKSAIADFHFIGFSHADNH